MHDRRRARRSGLRSALRLPGQVARLTWRPERLAAERQRRLRALLAQAIAHSAFHRERLRGIDPATFTEADLARLPVMGKIDMMQRWNEVVTDPALHLDDVARAISAHKGQPIDDRYRAFATGGTSGRSGIFVYDPYAWETALVAHLRTNVRARLRRPSSLVERPVLASIVAEGQGHLSTAIANAFVVPGVSSHRFAVTERFDALIDTLNEIRPTTLVTYGSLFADLIAEAEHGRLRVKPSFVVSTSDPLSPSTRAAIERLWTRRISNVWATTEVGPTAIGCGEGEGMHLLDDLVIYEPVDLDNQPVPPGTVAPKMLVTPLFNLTMPLIRYELCDEVRLLPEPCPCGSTHRRIDDIQGRTDDAFRWGDLRVDAHLFRSAFSYRTAITQYQVHQTPRGVEIDLTVDGPVGVDELARYLADRLRGQGLRDPQVDVRIVDRIDRVGHGSKLRRFVPMPAPV